MGDTEGGVCILEFSRATSYLFIPAVGSNNHITFHELLEQKYEGVRTTYFPKVQHNPSLLPSTLYSPAPLFLSPPLSSLSPSFLPLSSLLSSLSPFPSPSLLALGEVV